MYELNAQIKTGVEPGCVITNAFIGFAIPLLLHFNPGLAFVARTGLLLFSLLPAVALLQLKPVL